MLMEDKKVNETEAQASKLKFEKYILKRLSELKEFAKNGVNVSKKDYTDKMGELIGLLATISVAPTSRLKDASVKIDRKETTMQDAIRTFVTKLALSDKKTFREMSEPAIRNRI